MTDIIEPDDSLADLTDEEQVAMIEQTDNGLTPEDEDFEQPLPPTEKKADA